MYYSRFPWKLFIALVCILFLPSVYQMFRVAFISDIPSDATLNISGQMEWFDLIDETIKAFLIVPMYFILNQVMHDRNKLKERIQEASVVILLLYGLFSVVVYLYVGTLVNYMTIPSQEQESISYYMQLETVAFVLGILWSFYSIVFVLIGKVFYFYSLLVLQVTCMIIGDSFFINTFGVNGIAYTNMLVNGLLILVSGAFLYRERLMQWSFSNWRRITWLKAWVTVGSFSLLQQFIDNFFYAVMISKMVNKVADQGVYWVANNFIWGWLLIPVMAISELIKRECVYGWSGLRLRKYIYAYLILFGVWVISIPSWKWLFAGPMNLDEPEAVFSIVLKLLPFYMAFAFSSLCNSIFYGLGKTKYTFYTSLVVNLVYYGIFYLLVRSGTIVADLDFIILLFGFGMVVNLLVTSSFFLWEKKRQNAFKNDMSI